jgi:hypothetical protein
MQTPDSGRDPTFIMSNAPTLESSQQLGSTSRGLKLSRLISSRSAAIVGFLCAAFALYVGWTFREGRMIDPGEGIGYTLGIAGAVPMVLLLLYSFRKRLRFMRHFGATKYWFRFHMMFGIIGPVIILYHSNFQVGSLNSQVALFCTLLVAGSGIVGRYLYTQIHHGLYGRKSSLRELNAQLTTSSTQLSSRDGFIDDIREELGELSNQALTPPDTIWESICRPIVMSFRTRWLYHRMSWVVRRKLIAKSVQSPIVAQHRERLTRSTQRFLRQHLRQTRKVAQFSAYERLFSLWHIIHVPFFCMMVVSAIVHVVAVHMY